MTDHFLLDTSARSGANGDFTIVLSRGLGGPAKAIDPQDPRVLLGSYLGVRRHVVIAVLVIATLVGSFCAWSVFAPLATGVVASGTIGVESHRKTIQHLEGGIIQAIHVREGDVVRAGDVLISLDDTQARATAAMIDSRLLAAVANEARLLAQRNGVDRIAFPAELLARRNESAVAAVLVSNQQAFDTQRAAMDGRRQIHEQQIRQSEQEIASLEAQITAAQEQLGLIAQEIADVQYLVERGLERRPRLRSLQRNRAELDGKVEGDRAMIVRAQQSIAETRLKIADLDNSFRHQVTEELRGVQQELAELRERAHAANATLARALVTAPLDGIVVNLRVFTIGGVIGSGQPILDLVPQGDDLIVTAQTAPQDRESLAPGLPAQVILSGLNRRTTPILDGEVIQVSADRLEDQRTGRPYFQAQIRIAAGQLAQLDHIRLYPGMPVEVKIVTGERSALQYLTEPLTSAMRRAFISK